LSSGGQNNLASAPVSAAQICSLINQAVAREQGQTAGMAQLSLGALTRLPAAGGPHQ